MEPLYYVMAIMGCADSGAACQEARVEPVRYESAATCRSAMNEALLRNTDLSFPTISAACQSNTERMARTQGDSSRG
ncbi:hypothetical protein [Sphingomonas japonica]|uniref:Lipoprotein n=1 Tax=Sphingomonas japonica TaxID=511662 RepID=A0ABX0U1G5_9SPHN|nr:hypothetical protein [Sphingomonas japonica]NIJ23541.1 hypothetical protein [Sphingomonas japonica]